MILGPNQNRKVVLSPLGRGEGTEKDQRQCCGTGTVTFCLSGTGTIIQYWTLAEPEP
jgi:hypothetical protein